MAKANLFAFMARVKRAFFRFKCFRVEIMNETPTRPNVYTINVCVFKKQFRACFLAATDWRPNSYLPNSIVIKRACFFCTFTLFLVMVKTKILKSSNCLIKSHCAAGHFFANLPLRKLFFKQNNNSGSLSFR